MSTKLPPPQDPRSANEPEASTVSRVETVVAEDRRKLNEFVRNLHGDVPFDEMDEALKNWWLNRY